MEMTLSFNSPIEVEKADQRWIAAFVALEGYEGEWSVVGAGGRAQCVHDNIKLVGKYIKTFTVCQIELFTGTHERWRNFLDSYGINELIERQRMLDTITFVADTTDHMRKGYCLDIRGVMFYESQIQGRGWGTWQSRWSKESDYYHKYILAEKVFGQ